MVVSAGVGGSTQRRARSRWTGADLLDRRSLGAASPGELDLAGGPGVADPADVAVRSDEPAPAVLDQDDRDRVGLPNVAVADGEDLGVAAGQSDPRERGHRGVYERPRAAEVVGLRHVARRSAAARRVIARVVLAVPSELRVQVCEAARPVAERRLADDAHEARRASVPRGHEPIRGTSRSAPPGDPGAVARQAMIGLRDRRRAADHPAGRVVAPASGQGGWARDVLGRAHTAARPTP